ncbi:hypothetical protein Tco_1395114 [Tanacetum coccineum]
MVSKLLAELLNFFGTDGEETQWQIQVSFAAANNLVALFSFARYAILAKVILTMLSVELENPTLTQWRKMLLMVVQTGRPGGLIRDLLLDFYQKNGKRRPESIMSGRDLSSSEMLLQEAFEIGAVKQYSNAC